jgi:hypothetical protein
MERREDLNPRSKLTIIANGHLAYVENDAVEIEEHPLAKLNVSPVIAVKGWLHPDAVSSLSEDL